MGALSRPYAVVLAAPSVSSTFDVERQVLAQAGIDLVERDMAALPRADLVLTFGYTVDASLIGTLQNCKGIVSFSTGLDHVDLKAAEAAGIAVRNVPDYAMQEVAEHAIALLLALARRVPMLDRTARMGDWNWRPVMGEVHTISGRVLGVVGLGRIGRRVAAMAQGLGLRVIGHDPLVSESEFPLRELEQLLAESDFVSLHVPLTAETRHLIGARELALMKPSAFLVNTARGGLVNESALLAALCEGRLAGTALDVREQEPPPSPDPLAALPNVVLTPHVGAFSVEAHERLHVRGAQIAIELYESAR